MPDDKETPAKPIRTPDDAAFHLWQVLRVTDAANRAKQLAIYAECRRAALGIGEFAGKE